MPVRSAVNSPLEKAIRERIARDGPMRLDAFMEMAVTHYYATRDPFGAQGDFTTAPEITQMYGELLGLWAADAWTKLGRPPAFTLLECGPGRGTLMADALRATRIVPGFHTAARIVLLETSPVLIEKQKKSLAAYDMSWVNNLEHPIIQSSDHPIICIASEFLDALPIRQWKIENGQWHEKVITIENDKLIFSHSPVFHDEENRKEGEVLEFSPAREGFVRDLCALLKRRSGAGLFIDYGHDRQEYGDTLQAVKDHGFVPVLEMPGECDLTSHVDFAALKRVAMEESCAAHGPVSQGVFFENLGVGQRATQLGQETEAERLSNPLQMGELFRVMAVCHDSSLDVCGFQDNA